IKFPQDLVAAQPSDKSIEEAVGDLYEQPWFFGPISRMESEVLVGKDGDFLVRSSQIIRGQYILTGMVNKQHQHMMLIDPEDYKVRDRMGAVHASIPKLVLFYHYNRLFLYFNDDCMPKLLYPVVDLSKMQK